MEDLKSRVAYLKGLAAGLDLDKSSREGKLFAQLIDVVEAMSESIIDLQEEVDDLADYTEGIDEDLNELEEDFYEEELDDEDLLIDEDEELFSVECPDCHELVLIDDDMLEDEDVVEILCPNCERVVFVNDDEAYEDLDEELNKE